MMPMMHLHCKYAKCDIFVYITRISQQTITTAMRMGMQMFSVQPKTYRKSV